MSIIDYLLIASVAAAVGLAVLHIIKQRRKSGCSGCCTACNMLKCIK